MKLRQMTISVAAAGLVVAPVAAQAGTRAASSVPVSLASMAPRASTMVDEKNKAKPAVVVLGVVALGAVTYGVVKALDDNKSKGT